MESIHRRIKRLREEKELSQEGLASLVGVSYQSVQEWEREGGTAPSRKRQPAVAKALGVSVEQLMVGGDAPSQAPPEQMRGLSKQALQVARIFDQLTPDCQQHVRQQVQLLSMVDPANGSAAAQNNGVFKDGRINPVGKTQKKTGR